MSITKILADKELSCEEKVEQVGAIVEKAREAYGNSEAKIPSRDVDTVHGSMPFEHLSAESKVAVLSDEVGRIKAMAVETSRQTPGVSLNKEIEKALAVNSFFNNLGSSEGVDYI